MYGGRRIFGGLGPGFVGTKVLVCLALLSQILIVILVACKGPPEAQMVAGAVGGRAPLSVSFTNNSQNADDFQWDFGDGATTITTTVEEPVTHEYTKVGTHTVTLKAIQKGERPPQTSTATQVITVEPGPLSRVVVDTTQITATPGEEHTFSAELLDQFDNPIAGLSLVFRSEEQAGTVDNTGRFTAGTQAGTYDDAVTVEVSEGVVTKAAKATVIIGPGPLDRVTMEPPTATLEVTREQRFVATAFDRFDNPIPDLTYAFKADEQAGEVGSGGTFAAGKTPGVYEDAVTVEVSQDSVARSATVIIAVEPGPLDHVTIEPTEATLDVTAEQRFIARAFDRFDNPIPDLSYAFEADERAGKVDDDGRFAAGREAGLFADAVTVEVTQGSIASRAAADVTLEHGPLERVQLDPGEATLDIRERQQFDAQAFDAYGNAIPEASVTWKTNAGTGAIDGEGLLAVGVRAGTYPQGVAVTAELDGVSVEATASVTVKPDPLDTVTLASVEMDAGQSRQLEVVAEDRYGNLVETTAMSWTVTDGNAGFITQAGLLTAGEVVGSFAEAVEAQASKGPVTRTTTASVSVTPGPLDRLVAAPISAFLGMGMTQQFVAVGVDQFGNRISGLGFAWTTTGGGTIDANGLFTAGTEPGTYDISVEAATSEGGSTVSGIASVTIEPDRIAFISHRDGHQFDIYLMNVDGTNVQRLTFTTAPESLLAWLPNGRRLVYDSRAEADGIVAINDDGSWKRLILENSADTAYVWPALSPDGRKIAFVKMTNSNAAPEDQSLDIFVADVDAGNVTRLTHTPGHEHVPQWSPDGTKIVYDLTPVGGAGDIWVMNANGTDKRRLTSDPANESHPSFSPDGTEILFASRRDGDNEIYVMDASGGNLRRLTSNSASDWSPSWSADGQRIVFHSKRDGNQEIYVMDRDGSKQGRLTNNSEDDRDPRWAPRKRGVEVSEASIVVPDASALKPASVQEVTANARDAVVRIETDLASGSGFIIDSDGLILTNNHVISDAKEITVFVEDGASYAVTVLGRDLVRDLAVVEIDASDLPMLELGDLSQVPLASETLVLGFPLGESDLTVTRGIVSSIKLDTGRNVTWIQTDAAINTGNSGGPLLNLRGQVTGVVSAKIVGVRIEGVGFAVSANTVKLYLGRLKAGEVIAN